ncbi:DUF1499 domain-containing protein [uncultured Alsobacter sp.]|uniref:DUF1499 domain-containing protein n=1 Tax=uncultured Alsobacter sp. TaxID=1748258 RepID=UPI0025E78D99|nr:DUF1499 domain-containing protein [uncultured Alsobacter sp.]
MLTILGALLAVVAISIALRDKPFGIERVWTLAFGPPDLGPVDFSRLVRRTTPNDALICPPGLCGGARSDLPSPVFALSAPDLREKIRAVALAEPGAVQVAEAVSGRGDRYVVRTPLMRYPDTVDVLVLPQPEGKSTVALYSRSQIGRSDLGANLARLKRWLAALGAG